MQLTLFKRDEPTVIFYSEFEHVLMNARKELLHFYSTQKELDRIFLL